MPKQESASKAAILEIEKLIFIIAIIFIVGLTAIYFYINTIWPTISTDWSAFIKALATGLIPVSILFAISFIFLRNTKKLKDVELKSEYTDIVKNIIRNERDLKEVIHVSYSYMDTDWRALTDGCDDVKICIFYSSNAWINKNIDIFDDYLKTGGNMTVFMPNPITLNGKFFGNNIISRSDSKKIVETFTKLYGRLGKLYPDNFKIQFSDQGFNFMFASLSGPGKKEILLSPYSNNYDRVDSPAVVFDELAAPPELSRFVQKELQHMKPSTKLFNFEESELIVWNEASKKVFVSSDLSCSARCSFCFVESLKESESMPQTFETARIFYLMIVNDQRFESGVNGTTIMLGGFTDPFLPKNIDFSIELIKLFGDHPNFIHIATRFTVGERAADLEAHKSNLVVNYSVASLGKPRFEPANFDRRMQDATSLCDLGFKVALFVRPVIANETIQHIPKIIESAKNSGIKVVTVGGLYVDNGIRERMAAVNDTKLSKSYIDGQHVLDSKAQLKKIDVSDIDRIVAEFEKNDFVVFRKADHRIEYFQELNS